jgi:hypothetical protein
MNDTLLREHLEINKKYDFFSYFLELQEAER